MMKIKKIYLLVILFSSFFIIACNNVDYTNETADDVISQEVVIGDELIYGESFSFQNVYEAILGELEDTTTTCRNARNLDVERKEFEFEDSDLVEMVYFSVQPTSSDSIKLINEKMGYLNPVELNKDILQACDAEKIIFTKTDISDEDNIEDYIDFTTKYYYIVTKDIALEMAFVLEGFSVIEEFEMLTEDALEKVGEEYQNLADLCDDEVARGIFSTIWNGIKSAAKTVANAVTTVAKSVIDFLVKPYTISGKVYYTYNNIKKPAYGVKVNNVTIGGNRQETDINGAFNLGSRTDSAGLCFLWLNYENRACKLSNFLGVTASTLVKTALPSYLQNVTITSDSDYANAKMAICSDMLSRYKDESKRHSNIPQAVVWTTEFGNGTSSAPAFHVRGLSILPDIILTGVTADANEGAKNKLNILHHEYTHFLHCVYAENKNNFWDNIVLSEMGCTIATATVDLINDIFNSNISTGYIGSYNFDNPYVYFAENYAEWYSLVGFYGKGIIGKTLDSTKGSGIFYIMGTPFDNQKIFTQLVTLLNSNGYSNSADIIVNIIDKDNVTTFNELYSSLIKQYPSLKNKINNTFKGYYVQKGSKNGNVIIYQ